MCDFAKRFPHRPCSRQCSRKKKQGACCLAGCQLRAQAQTYPWVGCFLVLSENQGGRERRFCQFWSEFYVRKQCKVREFFLWPRPAKSMRWLIIITLLAEPWGKWLTSHKLHGWEGWVMVPWSWASRDSVQSPCMKSRQIYKCTIIYYSKNY